MALLDIWETAAWGECLQSASRCELMRNSLYHARDMTDSGLKRLARPPKADDSAQASDVLKAISLEIPSAKPAMLQSWDHGNAGYWLWD